MKKYRFLLSVLLLITTTASDFALALSDGYESPELKDEAPWTAILYLVVALAGICIVAFKNSRRTHLD